MGHLQGSRFDLRHGHNIPSLLIRRLFDGRSTLTLRSAWARAVPGPIADCMIGDVEPTPVHEPYQPSRVEIPLRLAAVGKHVLALSPGFWATHPASGGRRRGSRCRQPGLSTDQMTVLT